MRTAMSAPVAGQLYQVRANGARVFAPFALGGSPADPNHYLVAVMASLSVSP